LAEQRLTAGQGMFFLTLLSTVSQLIGFGYRVCLSRLVGAEVMGLYQLLMPVYSVFLSLTAVGLTSAVSNLTAQRLALNDHSGARRVLQLGLRGFFLLLLPLALVVIPGSDAISVTFLGDARTQLGLILLIPCVAFTGVENLHKQAFYGAGLVRTPALVDLLEQLVRTVGVLGLLLVFLPQYPERALGLIVAGMILCEIFSSTTLAFLHRRQRRTYGRGKNTSLSARQMAAIALPVSLNALLGNLMGAANAALVPQKLLEAGLARSEAISQFGVVNGMVLPLLALPTVFLGPLNLILVPRLARAHALQRSDTIGNLILRALSVTAVLTLPAMTLMSVLGPDLSRLLFHQERSPYFLPLAITMAMSCYLSVLCAALNGIDRQKTVTAISLTGNVVQLLFTVALVPLPGVGMAGYVLGGLASACLELILLLWQVTRHTQLPFRPFQWLIAPGLAALLAGSTGNLLFRGLKDGGLALLPACAVVAVFFVVLYLIALQAQGIHFRHLFRVRQ